MTGNVKATASATARRVEWLIFVFLLAALALAAPTYSQTPVHIRVHVGGSAYTDSAGNLWSADTGFNNGTVYSIGNAISGTSDPALFQFGRWSPAPTTPPMRFSASMPNGTYEVRLHFAEPVASFAAYSRLFDINIEGAACLEDLDIAAEVGPFAALIKAATVRVIDGQLDIDFVHGPANNPTINAIEVNSVAAPTTPLAFTARAKSGTQIGLVWNASTGEESVTGYRLERCTGAGCSNFVAIASPGSLSYSDSGLLPLTTYRYRIRSVDVSGHTSIYSQIATVVTSTSSAWNHIRINVGGPAYTDTSAVAWSADKGFNCCTPYSLGNAVSGAADQTIYKSGRYDESPALPAMQYRFAVPNGSYEVRLHLAEPYYTATGGRVFSVDLEGVVAIPNIDIASEVGLFAALVKSGTTQVNDGYLEIGFVGAAGEPMANAIEVLQLAAADSQAPSSPNGFSSVPVSSSRVDLAWAASTDNVAVDHYEIERCVGLGCIDFRALTSVSAPAFSNTSLAANTAYRYRIRAVDAAGNYSAYSVVANATTLSMGDSQAPTVPANFGVSSVSASQVALSWSASTDNTSVAGYRVERCQGVGCTSFLQMASLSDITFADDGRLPGTVYRYRVRAVDSASNYSDFSPIISATTLSGSGDVQPPSAPGTVTANGYSANRVDLSWLVATDNIAVAAYFIERCVGANCSNYSQIAALPAVTTYRDTGLQGNQTLRYRIRAQDVDGNVGPYSGIVTVATAGGAGTVGSATYQYDSFGRLRQVTVVPQ